MSTNDVSGGCRAFWQTLGQLVGGVPSLPLPGGGLPTGLPSDPSAIELGLPGAETGGSGPASASGAQADGSVQDLDDLEMSCPTKWLVITIDRHTRHLMGGRWDCTQGTLRMELWDSEDAGSGPLVFTCDTSERGGPGTAAFSGSENSRQGSGYAYFNQFMIVARDSYGLSPHSTANYSSYSYRPYAPRLPKPRPGIAVYGSGPGAMDRRTGVLIHCGTSHTWSVGCIVLHRNGSVVTRADGTQRFMFDGAVSYTTVLDFLDRIHQFAGQSRLPLGARIPRLKLIIKESF